MKILFICSLLLFIGYFLAYFITAILKKEPHIIPDSLSATAYFWEKIKKNAIAIFSGFMIFLMFITAIPLINTLPETITFLGFFSVMGIGFVGVAPLYKDTVITNNIQKKGLQTYVHYIFAGISALSASIIMLIIHLKYSIPYPIFLISLWIIGILCTSISLLNLSTTFVKRTFLLWIELLLFIGIYETLYNLLFLTNPIN